MRINKTGVIPRKGCYSKPLWCDRLDEESDRKIAQAKDFIKETMVKTDKVCEDSLSFYAISQDYTELHNGEFILALARFGYKLELSNDSSTSCLVNVDYDDFRKRYEKYCKRNKLPCY
ncbi:hypothetical protein ACFL7D_01935 [candidate division KSB1 bacterium]